MCKRCDPKSKTAPFVILQQREGELWLVERDEHGLIRPLGETGPMQIPPGWRAALTQR